MKVNLAAVAFSLAGMVVAQTQVNQSRQTKNDDYSAASFVIPFPTGTSLPALCTKGSMYFNTSAPAGSNLYGCAASNTWILEGGGSGGAAISSVLTAQQVSTTTVTVGGTCSIAAQCLVQIGSTVYGYGGAATVTLNSGTGAVYLYVDVNGNITAGESAAGAPSLTCTGCVLASPITQFPQGTVPLAIWSASGGAWVSGSSEAALQGGGPALIAGTNISLAQSGGSVTIAASLQSLPSGSAPNCSSTTGGFMWYVPGSTGVADVVEVCAKDASNSFAWRLLY